MDSDTSTNIDFDWEFYTQFYEDLSRLSDYEKAYAHWIMYGGRENRYPSLDALCKAKIGISVLELPEDFDFKRYIQLNPDLQDFCKDNKYRTEWHYLSCGMQEERPYLEVTGPSAENSELEKKESISGNGESGPSAESIAAVDNTPISEDSTKALTPDDEAMSSRAHEFLVKRAYVAANNLAFLVIESDAQIATLDKSLSKSEVAEHPFIGLQLSSDLPSLLIASVVNTEDFDELCISIYGDTPDGQDIQIKCDTSTAVFEGIQPLLSTLDSREISCLANILKFCGTAHCDLVDSREVLSSWQLCQQAGENVDILLEHGAWLAPNILYFEASITERWILGDYEIVVASNNRLHFSRCQNFQIDHNQLAGLAVFEHDVYTEPYQTSSLTFLDGQSFVSVDKAISMKQYSLEFVRYLNSKSDHQRELIQEKLSRAAITLSRDCKDRRNGIALVKKLQRYVLSKPFNAVDPELPFQLFFDQVIPIGCDGVFVSGWLHDPYESLEEIEAVTALGFRFSLSSKYIYRTERQDVREHLRATRYGQFDEKPGFFAYIKSDEETRRLLQDFDQFHNVRFCIKLKDNITVEVTPDIKYCDVFAARGIVSKIIPADQVEEDMLKYCISPAAAKLQEMCMEKIEIQEVIDIGTLCPTPRASIIIPLYKRYDFLKIQIPLFANDVSLRSCEIIYVLDSPWQAKELTAFLREQSQLYQLPIKLVIMKRNSGYSSANNAGASQSKGEYLLLMNSDVFPCESGWMDKMLEFYQSSPKIGTVGAKLIYEDGSIQHAGMFFEKTTFPFWLTLHFYKGFPNKYGPANTARAVPSVTGACLLISKMLYDRVDGMSTEYVIGDFEDSDLCFKCTAQGYENWYYPETEFYHLERQSVPLNSSYSGSLVWHHNARLHEKKWGELIGQIMKSTM